MLRPILGSSASLRLRLLRRSLSVVAVLWVLAAVGLDAWGRLAGAPLSADAIVVAGCHVRPDGKASAPLQARTRLAVELWRRGVASKVVFTGGVGTHPPSEAEAALSFAHSLGLPDSAAVVERRSTSTRQNAALASRVSPAQRVVVVSDAYHVLRCKLIFGRYFPSVQAVGVTSEPWTRVLGSAREVVALSWYLLVGQWLPEREP
jgi:uncharacterized SAM-binding protein YcdF (DUF218 family)